MNSPNPRPPGRTPPGIKIVPSSAFDPLAALHDLEAGVVCVNAEWRIVFANRAWERALGATPGEYVGADLWTSFPTLDHAPESAAVRATARDGEVRTFTIVYNDARVRGTYVVRASRLSTGDVVLALRDNAKHIEARERGRENEDLRRHANELLDQAQVASQAKSVFIATISHELRTPLTALTGYGELLADEIVGPLSSSQHEVLDRMRSVTHHLTAMIDELLAYTRLEGGRETMHAAEVHADTLIQSTIAVVEPLARAKGLACITDIPATLPRFVTDADKVRQILVNLAGNAVKFTEEGSITIGVDGDEKSVRFHVRDTGSGITADDQTRLFQPFTQLDSGLTRRHGGTGLGLYISRRLADLIGGSLECASVLGEGSSFTLVLPASVEPGA